MDVPAIEDEDDDALVHAADVITLASEGMLGLQQVMTPSLCADERDALAYVAGYCNRK